MTHRLTWAVGTIYYLFGAGASLFADYFNTNRSKAAVLVVGLVISGCAYYLQKQRKIIEVRDETVEELLEDFLLPNLISRCETQIEDPPELRANVMLFKRRHIWPFGSGRFMWPWKKSLKVDFACGDYGEYGEDRLIWAIGEGVCGTAIEYNRECWSDIEDVDVTDWRMTERQIKDTEHLGSVISVPIYSPKHKEKNDPIGVLNVDSTAELEKTRFDDEEVKEIILNHANYIGTLP